MMKRLQFLLFMFTVLGAAAQVPGTLSYQGILMESDGVTPVSNGTHTVVFSFYDAPTEGNLLGTRTVFVNTVSGLFTCIIGSGATGSTNAPLVAEDISTQQTYIGLSIDGGTELVPRTQLTPAVYAMRAQTVETYRLPEHGNGPVPAGAIIMWSGSPTEIPYGYVLCSGGNYEDKDGNVRTIPDLRGRFVVGYDPGTLEAPVDVTTGKQLNYALIGNTGGQNTHTLTVDEMPKHNHTASTGTSGSHTHTGTTNTAGNHQHDTKFEKVGGTGSTYGMARANDEGETWPQTNHTGNHTHTFTTEAAGSHSHTVTINDAGESVGHENRPPYFVLAYIMKKY